MSLHNIIEKTVSDAIATCKVHRHTDYEFYECGNLMIKMMPLPYAGYSVMTHAHHYDHITMIANGAVMITTGETEVIYKAPALVTVKAHTHHGIVALEDNTVAYCIHDKSQFVDDAEGLPFKGT